MIVMCHWFAHKTPFLRRKRLGVSVRLNTGKGHHPRFNSRLRFSSKPALKKYGLSLGSTDYHIYLFVGQVARKAYVIHDHGSHFIQDQFYRQLENECFAA